MRVLIKYRNYLLLVLFLASIFLPFMKMPNVLTYTFVYQNGYVYAYNVWSLSLFFVSMLFLLFISAREDSKVKRAIQVIFVLAALIFYLYNQMRLFLLAGISQALQSFAMLGVGFYISFLLLIILFLSLNFTKKE